MFTILYTKHQISNFTTKNSVAYTLFIIDRSYNLSVRVSEFNQMEYKKVFENTYIGKRQE